MFDSLQGILLVRLQLREGNQAQPVRVFLSTGSESESALEEEDHSLLWSD